ncbi:uncharacterized protein ATNIH1004_010129 [Aspergillus tanneri]|uniref:Extracellular membrane protein CFEM domain-containing protein n=1 Tax=Aspergillus tanneri TaxID=1220188 RepID=A0A5M9M9A3_9EURO|nr:uncharacterized protein ATNIH1004_010129 [Aspergillus tanneri]KAA8643361.1 hypothetical protein ATNIH1004_010129 [Aspergillus tanneri]
MYIFLSNPVRFMTITFPRLMLAGFEFLLCCPQYIKTELLSPWVLFLMNSISTVCSRVRNTMDIDTQLNKDQPRQGPSKIKTLFTSLRELFASSVNQEPFLVHDGSDRWHLSDTYLADIPRCTLNCIYAHVRSFNSSYTNYACICDKTGSIGAEPTFTCVNNVLSTRTKDGLWIESLTFATSSASRPLSQITWRSLHFCIDDSDLDNSSNKGFDLVLVIQERIAKSRGAKECTTGPAGRTTLSVITVSLTITPTPTSTPEATESAVGGKAANTDPSSESSTSGLSTGAKIGIWFGIPLGIILIVILLWMYRRRTRCRSNNPLSPGTVEEQQHKAAPPPLGAEIDGNAIKEADGRAVAAALTPLKPMYELSGQSMTPRSELDVPRQEDQHCGTAGVTSVDI